MRSAAILVVWALVGCGGTAFSVQEQPAAPEASDAGQDVQELAQDSVTKLTAEASAAEVQVVAPDAGSEPAEEAAAPEAYPVDPPVCSGMCTPSSSTGPTAYVACNGLCGGACFGTCTDPNGQQAPQYDGRPCGPGPGWICNGTCGSVCIEKIPTACAGTCS